MAQILQILTVHAQLRASPSNPPGRVDEVGRGAPLSPWLKGSWGGRGFQHLGGAVECVFTPTAAAIGEENPDVLFSAAVKASKKLNGFLVSDSL